MAIVALSKISKINVKVVDDERGIEGKIPFSKEICDIYLQKEMDKAPKSKEEAAALGIKGWNGLGSSLVDLERKQNFAWVEVTAKLAPARYFFSNAMKEYVKQYNPDVDEMKRISPHLANVSIIAPVRINGVDYLLGQVKGDVIGQGQVHASLAAGGVTDLHSIKHPLVKAIQDQCSGKVGIHPDVIYPESFAFIVDEYEIGLVNFVSVAFRPELTKILEAYDLSSRAKLANNEKLDVAGLALLPIGGPLKQVKCYFPSLTGLQERMEQREIRPYTCAVLTHLSSKENMDNLLHKAELFPR